MIDIIQRDVTICRSTGLMVTSCLSAPWVAVSTSDESLAANMVLSHGNGREMTDGISCECLFVRYEYK